MSSLRETLRVVSLQHEQTHGKYLRVFKEGRVVQGDQSSGRAEVFGTQAGQGRRGIECWVKESKLTL